MCDCSIRVTAVLEYLESTFVYIKIINNAVGIQALKVVKQEMNDGITA